MTHKCPLGREYATMAEATDDALFLVEEGMARVLPRVWHCVSMDHWHVGDKEKRRPWCPVAKKEIFATRRIANLELMHTAKKFAQGWDHRKECRAYQCGDHWHLTSQEVWDGKEESP